MTLTQQPTSPAEAEPTASFAETAEAVLAPIMGGEALVNAAAPVLELDARDIVEPHTVAANVRCAADADPVDTDVLITSLQDIQVLEDGRCEVRL